MNAGRPPEMPGASDTMDRRSGRTRRVGLFVTCLVDLFARRWASPPSSSCGAAGCTVEVPTVQTCCGQPAYNSGARSQAQAIARQVVAAFEGFDWVVAPSGSCAGMLRRHYPDLLRDDDGWGTARRGGRRSRAGAHVLPGRRLRRYDRGGFVPRYRGLSRLVLEPARHGRPGPAPRAAGQRRWPGAAGSSRNRGVLRLRRRVFGEVRTHIRGYREPQGGRPWPR